MLFAHSCHESRSLSGCHSSRSQHDDVNDLDECCYDVEEFICLDFRNVNDSFCANAYRTRRLDPELRNPHNGTPRTGR